MNDRLLEVIRYRCGGRQTAFARLLGWTPQYLGKLLRGENFGLSPALRILQAVPEVDARWLLLGEGRMLREEFLLRLRASISSLASRALALDRFVPVMSPEELHVLDEALLRGAVPSFSDEAVSRWTAALKVREEASFPVIPNS